MRLLVPLALAAVIAAAGIVALRTPEAGPPGLLRPDDAALVARGAEVYAEACASCHGASLEGQPDWRERREDGRLPAPPHDATGHTWHHPDAQLVALTALGPAALAGRGYRSDMPGFGDVLTEREIMAVLSFIKSTWPDEIRAAHDAMNREAAR
jgi:mono/diheme cytochrome c family protein